MQRSNFILLSLTLLVFGAAATGFSYQAYQEILAVKVQVQEDRAIAQEDRKAAQQLRDETNLIFTKIQERMNKYRPIVINTEPMTESIIETVKEKMDDQMIKSIRAGQNVNFAGSALDLIADPKKLKKYNFQQISDVLSNGTWQIQQEIVEHGRHDILVAQQTKIDTFQEEWMKSLQEGVQINP